VVAYQRKSHAGPDLHSVPILFLIKYDNKQITSIQYNHLNLPVHIDIATKPAQEGGRIEYLYDAAGIKLRQTKYIGATPDEETNYIGNFAYEGESSLKYIITDDGRLIPKTGGGFEYEYFIKDHPPVGGQALGNTRLTVQDSLGFAAIKQEDHYYPFGMVMSGQSWRNSTQTTKNDYLYNGKEFQDELGLDWYDYGARFYDAVIGRFPSVDAMAEKKPYLNPYHYCSNNPINKIDPDGNDDIWIPWQNKEDKAFQNEDERKLWVGAHDDLYSSNKIYKAVYDRLDNSHETFRVKQPNQDADWGTKGQYDDENNTVEPFMNLPTKDKAIPTMFEEMFHAGQDEFNTKNGFTQNVSESEVEAKFMRVVAGIGKDDYNIEKNCPNIIKTLKEGKPVDGKTILKDWTGVQTVALSIKKVYRHLGGNINGDRFLRYTNSLIKEVNKK
jgi:RHS repeat-associated protein